MAVSNELTAVQKLAIVDAFIKACKDEQKRIRDEVDEETIKLYLDTGADRRTVSLNGEKVGTISIVMTKPVEGKFPEIQDANEFAKWYRESDGGMDAINRLIALEPGIMLKAAVADGELPDGCAMVERNEPSRIKNTTLRISKDKVVKAMGAQLSAAVTGFIGGGE